MCGTMFLQDYGLTFDSASFAQDLYLASLPLQQRGQDGFGIVDDQFILRREFGEIYSYLKVPENFELFTRSQSRRYMVHTRYITAGKKRLHGEKATIEEYQPHARLFLFEQFGYAANGDFPDMEEQLARLEKHGIKRESDNDGEMMMLMAAYLHQKSGLSWTDAFNRIIDSADGAFSGVFMTDTTTLIVRDRLGIRPMVYGIKDDRIMVASETLVLSSAGYSLIDEVPPGAVMEINRVGKIIQHGNSQSSRRKKCMLELVYFSHPASRIPKIGIPLDQLYEIGSFRSRLGKKIMQEHPVEADMIVSLPRSGDFAWMGAQHQSGIEPYIIFTTFPGIGRTFITDDTERELIARLKYQLLSAPFRKNKRVVVVDDSMIRATTIKIVVKMMREAGAEEIHWRATYPEVRFRCDYGINIKSESELFAVGRTNEQMVQELNLNSLGFLSPKGLAEVLTDCGDSLDTYCTHCFSGEKPFDV